MNRAILSLLSLTLLGSAAHADALIGYWGDKGCRAGSGIDEYQISKRSNGKYNISSGEWGCDLSRREKSGSTYRFRASCSGEGGGDYSGTVMFSLDSPTSMMATLPQRDGSESTWFIFKCS